MKTSQRIKKAIISKPRGKLISTTKLVKYGPRTSVDKALSRLTKSGEITRVTRGVYVRPKENRFVGKNQVSTTSIHKIKTKLAASEVKKFVNAKEKMPAWMANTVLQFEQEDENE